MDRLGFIEYSGKRILLIDFSSCEPQEILSLMSEAGKLVGSQPEGSVRTLTDATDAHYNSAVTEALRDYVRENRPFVRAAAVVGMTGLKKVVMQTLRLLTKRDFSLFDTREEAKEYLAGF